MAVEGPRCRFRAHAPFSFVPWRVSDAKLAWSKRAMGMETAAFARGRPRADGPVRAEESPLPLRLHFMGEQRTALLLLSWLHEHLTEVELDVNGRATSLGRAAVRPWGFHEGEALLPIEPRASGHPPLKA